MGSPNRAASPRPANRAVGPFFVRLRRRGLVGGLGSPDRWPPAARRRRSRRPDPGARRAHRCHRAFLHWSHRPCPVGGLVSVLDGHTGATVHTFTGSGGGVWSVAWAVLTDGRLLLAVGRADGQIQVLDGHTGATVHTFTGHIGRVRSVAWAALPHGRLLLASGSDDGTVRLWNPDASQPVGEPLFGHTGWVTAVAFASLPDGRLLLASGSDDGAVRLWDPETGTPVAELLTGHVSGVTAVAFGF